METPFTIDNLIRSYTRIYEQLAPENVSVIENDLRKMMPSENSTVFMTGGANYTDNRISIDIIVRKPLPIEQTQNQTLATILKDCILRADVTKLAIMYRCVSFLENSWGNSYFIDGIPANYNEEENSYYVHLVILKENKVL